MTTDPALLAAEYLDLKARARDIDDRIKQIITELRDLGAGKHTAGNATITVTIPRRFDPGLAAQVLASSPDLLAACQETVVSSAKAKAVLAPALYESLMITNGDPRVSIR